MTARNRGPDARIKLHIVFRKHDGRIAALRQYRITNGCTAECRVTNVVNVLPKGFQAPDYRMPGGHKPRDWGQDIAEKPGGDAAPGRAPPAERRPAIRAAELLRAHHLDPALFQHPADCRILPRIDRFLQKRGRS